VKILQINFDFHLHFADEHTLATWLTRQSGQANTAGKMKMKTKRAKENKAKTKTAQSKKKNTPAANYNYVWHLHRPNHGAAPIIALAHYTNLPT